MKLLDDSGLLYFWNSLKSIINKKYEKPASGIPESDLTADVQEKLNSSVDTVNMVYPVVGTQTAATNTWKGKLSGVTGFTDGMTILYYLPYSPSSATTSTTLTLYNDAGKTIGGGSKSVYTPDNKSPYNMIKGGSVIRMTFKSPYSHDGTAVSAGCWVISETNTYAQVLLDSNPALSTKTGHSRGFAVTLDTPTWFTLNNVQANTYAGTMGLNINGTGKKTLYINGNATNSSNYSFPAGVYICYYDGSAYHIRTDGRFPGLDKCVQRKLYSYPMHNVTDFYGVAVISGTTPDTSSQGVWTGSIWVKTTNPDKDEYVYGTGTGYLYKSSGQWWLGVRAFTGQLDMASPIVIANTSSFKFEIPVEMDTASYNYLRVYPKRTDNVCNLKYDTTFYTYVS